MNLRALAVMIGEREGELMISVIVPIYQVEEYLRRCVDSLLRQTYQDFELILVDDGSPDGCGAICDAYASQEPRVRAVHKPNGGLTHGTRGSTSPPAT